MRNQTHTEDPHHLHRNAMEIKGQSYDSVVFLEDVGMALYGFTMNKDGLNSHLEEMRVKADGTGVEGYVKSLCDKKKKRCFAYTLDHFILSMRGDASRAEQAMHIIKAGSTRAQLRK